MIRSYCSTSTSTWCCSSSTISIPSTVCSNCSMSLNSPVASVSLLSSLSIMSHDLTRGVSYWASYGNRDCQASKGFDKYVPDGGQREICVATCVLACSDIPQICASACKYMQVHAVHASLRTHSLALFLFIPPLYYSSGLNFQLRKISHSVCCKAWLRNELSSFPRPVAMLNLQNEYCTDNRATRS